MELRFGLLLYYKDKIDYVKYRRKLSQENIALYKITFKLTKTA